MSRVVFRPVKIPHLNYAVRVRPIGKLPASHSDAQSYCQRDDRHGCTLFLSARATPMQVAHELIHALQFLFSDRHIDFIAEQEHAGYLMQYLMGAILGYEWSRP